MGGARLAAIQNFDLPQVIKSYPAPAPGSFGGNLVYVGPGSVQINAVPVVLSWPSFNDPTGRFPNVIGGQISIIQSNLAAGDFSGGYLQAYIDGREITSLRGVNANNFSTFPGGTFPLFTATVTEPAPGALVQVTPLNIYPTFTTIGYFLSTGSPGTIASWPGGYVSLLQKNLVAGDFSGGFVAGYIDPNSGNIALQGVNTSDSSSFPANSIPLFTAKVAQGSGPGGTCGLVQGLDDWRPLHYSGPLLELVQDQTRLVYWAQSYDIPQLPKNYGYPIPQPGSFYADHQVFIGPPNPPSIIWQGGWFDPTPTLSPALSIPSLAMVYVGTGLPGPVIGPSGQTVQVPQPGNSLLSAQVTSASDVLPGTPEMNVCLVHKDSCGRIVALDDMRPVP